MKKLNLKIAAGAALASTAAAPMAMAQNEQPDILLVVIDDLGYADMSFLPLSPRDINTPNIDRIANNGLYFQNAYSTAGVSSPARAGLITGRYQQRWGNYWFSHGGLPDYETTIPEYLSEMGYKTVKVGKTHMNGAGEDDHPLNHGFQDFFGFIDHTHSYIHLSSKDVERLGGKRVASKPHVGPLLHNHTAIDFDDENAYTTDIFTDYAVETLQNTDEDQPLFMFLSYNAVHMPTYENIDKYNDRFGATNIEPWDPAVEPYDTYHNRNGLHGGVDNMRRSRYLACLSALDDGLGRVLDNVRENTLIVFLSDNGGTYNTEAINTPLIGHKYQMYEGGIRIPMILSWKGHIEPGVNNDDIVSALDVLPTVLDAAGFDGRLAQGIDGSSLFPVIEGDVSNVDRTLVWDSGWGHAVRKGEWKLYNVYKDRANTHAGVYLYHLASDIREEVNHAKKNPEKLKELEDIYQEWNKGTTGGPLKPADAKNIKVSSGPNWKIK